MSAPSDYRGEHAERSPAVATILGIVSPGSAWAYAGRPVLGVVVNTALVLPWLVFASIWARRGFSPSAPLGAFAAGWALLVVMAALDVRHHVVRRRPSLALRDTNHPLVYGAIWLFTLALPLVALHGVFSERLVSLHVVRDASMSPTLLEGDRVLVDRRIDGRSRLPVGALVSYIAPSGGERLGRIVGGPGDEVVVTWDIVFRNDVPAIHNVVAPGALVAANATTTNPSAETLGDATYVIDVATIGHTEEPHRWRLGTDDYAILHDNRRETSDSRQYGPIPRSRIQGLATHVTYSRTGDAIQLPLALELIAAPLLADSDRAERTGRRAQPYRSTAPPG